MRATDQVFAKNLVCDCTHLMVNAKMEVAVIVVSYNVQELLRNCLASIFSSHRHLSVPEESLDDEFSLSFSLSVVVVDNASADESAAMVATEFPDVHLLALEENVGFTAANNRALEYLGVLPKKVLNTDEPRDTNAPKLPKPTYVLLLNPDAELAPDALAAMTKFLHQTPAAGVCGARLTYGDGTFQHGAFRFPSLFQALIDFAPLEGIRGVHRLLDSRLNGRYSAEQWQGMEPFPVDFVLGAAIMLRTAAIETVGGMDEGFFMYCEEIDWCLRLREEGWYTFALPTAHVVHHEARSTQQIRWTSYTRLWTSRFRFFRKHRQRYSPLFVRQMRWIVKIGQLLRRRRAQHRFAGGEITGEQLAEELAAYDAVAKL